MLINFVDATNDANHYTKPPRCRCIVITALTLLTWEKYLTCNNAVPAVLVVFLRDLWGNSS